MRYQEIKNLARKLRNNPTQSEKELWKYLRKKQLSGRMFLRQHPIFHDIVGNEIFFYIPDFYCAEEKLAVELDGGIHVKRKGKDRQRDEILESKGIRVIRIKNEELANLPKVLQKIQSYFSNK